MSSEWKVSLLTAIHTFCKSNKCAKQDLLFIISKLSFACKVVPAGWIFLSWLIDLSCSVSKLYHHIHMTNVAFVVVQFWSGTSMMLDSKWTLSSAMQLFTDTSRKGWGAFWLNHWLQSEWSPEQAGRDIHSMERTSLHSQHLGSPVGLAENSISLWQ